MISFEIICNFQGGRKEAVNFYIGLPESGHHPIYFQSKWLNGDKGGSVPDDVMKSLQDLYNTAKTNNLDFSELCSFALQSATKSQRAVNRGGNGFASNRAGEEINKYAKEFLEQNGIKEDSVQEEESEQKENSEIKIQEIEKPKIIPKQDIITDSNDKKESKIVNDEQVTKDTSVNNNGDNKAQKSSSNDDSAYGEDSDLL